MVTTYTIYGGMANLVVEYRLEGALLQHCSLFFYFEPVLYGKIMVHKYRNAFVGRDIILLLWHF